MNWDRVYQLIKLEFIQEFRQKHALAGIFLFAGTTVFLIFKGVSNINPQVWNSLLWIVLLFSGINVVSKSFNQQNTDVAINNYTLFDPNELILAKLIYNFLYLLLMFIVVFILFNFFSLQSIKDWKILIKGVLLGSFGISCIYTFVSAVAMGENSGNVIISILSFPLVIPIFLILMKITAVAMRQIQDSSIGTDMLILMGLDLLLLGIILLLFPIIWRQ